MALFGGKPKTENPAAPVSRGSGLIQPRSGAQGPKPEVKEKLAEYKLSLKGGEEAGQ